MNVIIKETYCKDEFIHEQFLNHILILKSYVMFFFYYYNMVKIRSALIGPVLIFYFNI